VRALPVAHVQPGAWGKWVLAKINLPELLERELTALARSGKLAAQQPHHRAALFAAVVWVRGGTRRLR